MGDGQQPTMAQGNYIEEHYKRHGRRLDYEERKRKRQAREAHKALSQAQPLHGIKAKLLHKRRYAEKAAMKKTIKAHEERDVKTKALSSAVKQKRKEKAGKFMVPLPKVRGIAED